jgi:2',3'-cyclic-nucleotide 2'-phosphodiesterase/3'-nucleotidase
VYDENGELVLNKSGRPLLENRFYNFDTAAGIKYEADLTREPGERIRIFSMEDGTPFDPEKIYEVAMNSYRANGGGSHMTDGAGIPEKQLKERVIWVSENDMRSILADWIRSRGIIHPAVTANWSLLPVMQVRTLMNKDYFLLFGEE